MNGDRCFLLFLISLFAPASVWTAENDPPRTYLEVVRLEMGREVTFEMVLIPEGSFLRGSPENAIGRRDDEGPQHLVRLEAFYLSTTEVTLELFLAYYLETKTEKQLFAASPADHEADAISGPTPVYGDLAMGRSHQHPAIGMSWENAVSFTRWLSEKTGRHYRLPTEAEWEYACRAGLDTPFGFSGGSDELSEHAWSAANSEGEPHEVGQKKPNIWGLYDMSGNVREWVRDVYDPAAYEKAHRNAGESTPTGPGPGSVHVARGGDYGSSAAELRCAARAFEQPEWRDGDPQIPKSHWWLPFLDIIGFRLARSLEGVTVR